MRKVLLTCMMLVMLLSNSIGQTDPPDNNGGSDDINITCDTSHQTCMNNANFVYSVCTAGGSAGCYEKALESYNNCMMSRGCTPRTGVCFGSRTGTKACQ